MTDSIANTGDQLPQRMPVAADLMLAPSPAVLPAQLSAPTPRAAQRVLEFFTAQINNDHTRKALPERDAPVCRLVPGARPAPAHRRAAVSTSPPSSRSAWIHGQNRVRRRNANRLGFAVHLAYLRFPWERRLWTGR
jgi:hypothetical protein